MNKKEKCPINPKHQVFFSYVYDDKLRHVDLMACHQCEIIWYADGRSHTHHKVKPQ